MPNYRIVRRLLWCCALIVCGVAIAVVGQSLATRDWRRIQQSELGHLNEEQLKIKLNEIAESDDAVEFLVAALGHPDPDVSTAAAITLTEKTQVWLELDSIATSRKLSDLVRSFRQHVDQLPTRGKLLAGEIVERLIQSSRRASILGSPELLAQADYVVVASAEVAHESPWLIDDLLATHFESNRSLTQEPSRSIETNLIVTEPEALAEPRTTAGGGYEIGPSATSRVSILESPEFPQSQVIRPPSQPEMTSEQAPTSPAVRSISTANRAIAQQPLRSLVDLTDVEVMKLLHDNETTNTVAAERELARRGYNERQQVIAKAAVHPDVTVRRELADLLPRSVGVDVYRWLLLLAEDPDESVREIAQAVLASSGDPRVQQQLQQLRVRAPDAARSIPVEARRSLRSRQ